MKLKSIVHYRKTFVAGCLSVLLTVSNAGAGLYKVTVENRAPADGTRITPVWVGFHDGSFDTFDSGSSASSGLEMLAEDGDPSGILGSFSGQTDGVVFGPVTNPGEPPIFHPGEIGTAIFDVDTSSPTYFSFLSMVIPSNDAFIGNDDPTAYSIGPGTTIIDVLGSSVWDAGTEMNDEIPANTPLLGQMAPNTGDTEGGVVGLHDGFLVDGNVLTAFPGADFKAPQYTVARIKIESIPEPAGFALVAIGALTLRFRRRKLMNT